MEQINNKYVKKINKGNNKMKKQNKKEVIRFEEKGIKITISKDGLVKEKINKKVGTNK